MAEATTKFSPETDGAITKVAPAKPAIVVRSGPTDMLLRLSAMVSKKDTFLTRPVASLTKICCFC